MEKSEIREVLSYRGVESTFDRDLLVVNSATLTPENIKTVKDHIGFLWGNKFVYESELSYIARRNKSKL